MNREFLTVALAAAAFGATTAHGALINELQPNPAGGDPSEQTIELLGVAGDSFSGSVLTIDSDNAIGTVDRLTNVSGTFDANGLLTVDVSDLENPSFTIVLVGDDATVSVGDDLDTDGDGMLDGLMGLGTVFDAINIPDASADEFVSYADQLGGTSLSFIGVEPELLFRDATTLELIAIDGLNGLVFDAAGNVLDPGMFDMDPFMTTFGAVNPAATAVVPGPAALLLFASALGGLSLRRRA
ncbi:MAG: hypothetical protein AAFX85_05035 [Pseudomonadota bacterium]